MYYVTRYGFRPSKVAFLSQHAWSDKDAGQWPDDLPVEKDGIRRCEIKRWLEVFLFRFFRSANSNVRVSRMARKLVPADRLAREAMARPVDSEADVWLEELRCHVPD